MRKTIYRAVAILTAALMILCDNSIVSLASEIVPELNVDISEEDVNTNDLEESSEISDNYIDSDNIVLSEQITSESDFEDLVEEANDVLNDDGNIASGISNNVTWVIDSNGKLTVTGTGDWEKTESERGYGPLFTPWDSYRKSILSAQVQLSGVTDVSNMFSACENLQEVDLSKLVTSNVTDMSDMFYGCKNLLAVDLSNFDTSKVENMRVMFANCGKLESVTLGNFDTSKVMDMYDMFLGCSSLKEIDLSTFVISEDVEAWGLIEGCTSLEKIITPAVCIPDIELPKKSWKDEENSAYFVFPQTSVTLLSGIADDNGNVASGISNNVSWAIDANGKLTISGIGDWERDTDYYWNTPWENYVDEIISAEVSLTGTTNASHMFSGCHNLTNIDLKNFDTSDVTDMSAMFMYCSLLTDLDLSNFDTTNVTDMSCMFDSCDSITSLVVSNFNTSQVTDMNGMFAENDKLSSLDLSNFDTSNVINMSCMFMDCIKLEELTIDSFNTESVKTMSCMFENCSSLESLDLSNFNTENVKEFDQMFYGCTNLENLDVSGFDTRNVTTKRDLLDEYDEEEIFDSGMVLVYGMMCMFYRCEKLSELDLSYFTIPEDTNVMSLVNGCTSLKKIITPKDCKATVELPNGTWTDAENNVYTSFPETSKTLTTEECIAKGISNNVTWIIDTEGKLTVSGTGDWEVSGSAPWSAYRENIVSAEVSLTGTTDASYMFCGCINMTEVNLSKFDTANVTDMNNMFNGCIALEELDVSKFNTSNVTDMSAMFMCCSGLIGLDLNDFDTSNVVYMNSMFDWCSGLTSLDLRSFNTTNVTDMNAMFEGCSNLSNLNINGIKTSNVTNMSCMFMGCRSLISLDLSGFDTSNVIGMGYMFNSCIKLTDLNLDGFSTSKVTTMSGMFYGCESLTGLDLNDFDTLNVKDMNSMFRGCKNLTVLDLSNFETEKVIYNEEEYCYGMKSLFYGCSNLMELDLSSFTILEGMGTIGIFDGCVSLEKIITPKVCKVSVELPANNGIWKDEAGKEYNTLPDSTKKLSLELASKEEYDITYELDGGINHKDNPSSYKAAKTVTLKNPTKTGYTFAGWYDNSAFSGEKITTVKGKDITLYAKWTANVYTVTFNGNGGNYTPEGAKKATATKKQSFTYDESANLEANVFARKGYTFTGWNTKKDGKGKAYEPGAEVLNLTKTNKGNVNLYAQWKVNKYTVKFDINATKFMDGDLDGEMADVNATYNKSFKLTANKFTRKGYTFKGWATEADATKVKYKNKASVKNLSEVDGAEITLYAVWSINTYNVKFAANSGKGKAPATVKELQYGVNGITLPENPFTNKDIYKFAGWCVNKDRTNTLYYPGETIHLPATKNNQTITLYAIWFYDLEIYVGEGVDNLIIKEVPYGFAFPTYLVNASLESKVPQGYYVAGLATSLKNAQKGKMAYKTSIKNAAGKVLYPVYKPIKYTVKFDKNAPVGAKVTGKMSNVSATYGKAFTLKANAYKCSGHTFLGWSTNKDATEPMFTNKAKIEESLTLTNKEVVTLYAVWQ